MFGIEMRHLAQRMDAGIRPSSGMGLNRRAMDLRDGALEMVLNGATIGLSLPATETPAIVFEPYG